MSARDADEALRNAEAFLQTLIESVDEDDATSRIIAASGTVADDTDIEWQIEDIDALPT